MIALIKTYIDIISLRKGPDVIPASWLVFGVSLVLLGLAWTIQLSLLRVPAAGIYPVLVAYSSGLLLYASIARLSGFSHRIQQMLSTIIACGSLIAIFSVASGILLAQLGGGAIANIVAALVYFWSVPVKGHIVARTINKHWFIGISIAMLEIALRFTIESAMFAGQQGGGS